jgi:hypothetical protein
MRSPGYHAGPLVIPNVASLRLIWAIPNGKLASNVLHVSNPGGIAINPSLCDSILAGVNADARTIAYAANLATSTSLVGIRMRDLNVANRTEFSDTIGGFTGTGATDALPEGVAFCVTLKTAVSGRQGRGRVYLTGFDRFTLTPTGRATTTLTTDAVGFVQAVSDAAFANGLALTVANREHDAYTSPATGLTVPPEIAGDNLVVGITAADSVFDSQRRRK